MLLLVLGALLVRSLFRGQEDVLGNWVRRPGAGQPSERLATLYFSAPGGEGLQPEARTISASANSADEIRSVVEALIEGPRRGLVASISPEVRLLNVYVVDQLVVLDFSPEIQTTHVGGSVAELLTIYSLVNTLTLNFPTIDAVQLLVEGETVDTLNGHVDTRYPFRHNPDWVIPAAV